MANFVHRHRNGGQLPLTAVTEKAVANRKIDTSQMLTKYKDAKNILLVCCDSVKKFKTSTISPSLLFFFRLATSMLALQMKDSQSNDTIDISNLTQELPSRSKQFVISTSHASSKT